MICQEAVDLIKGFEGFFSKPYLCPAGVPTIGYGSTFYEDGTKVKLTDPAITKERANALLAYEINKTCVPAVLRLCPVLIGHEKKFGAVVSFTYNLGTGRLQASTLRRKINAQDWDAAADEFLKWNKAGGRVLKGLDLRRRAEAALFSKD